MRKFFAKTFMLSCICAVVILALFFLSYFVLPPAFADSYQKGFNYQYRALERSADTPKIIVLGGSYMTFATDSALLSKLSGMPSYTLGIHSGMGMCYIFETAEKFIKNGDIVVFSFRPFKKNDYGMDLIYLSFENEPELFIDFLKAHPDAVVKSVAPSVYTKLYNRIYQKLRWMVLHKMGIEDSVYTAASFDKNTGNMIYPRPSIDPTIPLSEFEPRFVYDTAEIDASCISELNTFSDFCKQHGAKFYVTYSPAYKGSVASGKTEIVGYEAWLSEKLKAPVISTIERNLLPKECVYNGALHMNDKGAERYTTQLYKDLCNCNAF